MRKKIYTSAFSMSFCCCAVIVVLFSIACVTEAQTGGVGRVWGEKREREKGESPSISPQFPLPYSLPPPPPPLLSTPARQANFQIYYGEI